GAGQQQREHQPTSGHAHGLVAGAELDWGSLRNLSAPSRRLKLLLNVRKATAQRAAAPERGAARNQL
ncbi:MAG TPA: hypothetical protein VFT04_04495, partial [Gemmatimonadales bacterium]|nr:hypothetical protein [Gemmatimonadales bacterium]